MKKSTLIAEHAKAAVKGIIAVPIGIATVAAPFCIATAAVNMVAIPMVAGFNGLERLTGEEITATGTIVKRDFVPLYNGGGIYTADFVLNNGRKIKLVDTCDIPHGNFLPNQHLREESVGKRYEMNLLGSTTFGYKILDAKER